MTAGRAASAPFLFLFRQRLSIWACYCHLCRGSCLCTGFGFQPFLKWWELEVTEGCARGFHGSSSLKVRNKN